MGYALSFGTVSRVRAVPGLEIWALIKSINIGELFSHVTLLGGRNEKKIKTYTTYINFIPILLLKAVSYNNPLSLHFCFSCPCTTRMNNQANQKKIPIIFSLSR